MKGKGGRRGEYCGVTRLLGLPRHQNTDAQRHAACTSMASLPATLLYFVVYNPSLKPTHKHVGSDADDDDEDAEEQAQVLFYTAKDHAVSKDRVLRQVGLSKALVNFSNMFGTHDTCDSVHSQGRRMLMLQPEPDYWIHACVELSKTERSPAKDDKSNKGKGQHRETQYDYSEASLHDGALRAQLVLAYESFKIKYGTFSSTMSILGKEALELQLERFFTVWAWSWNLEKPFPFSDYIGVRIHPLSNQLLPIIESSLEDRLPPHLTAIVLSQDHIITTKDKTPQYPPYLARHMLTFVSPRSPQTGVTSVAQDGDPPTEDNDPTPSDAKGKDDRTKKLPPDLGRKPPPKGGTFSKRFLGVHPLNVNVNATMSAMDVRKWSWPGYLTFGGSKDEQTSDDADKLNGDSAGPDPVPSGVEKGEKDNALASSADSSVSSASLHSRATSVSDVPVDSQALLDAFSNMQSGSSTPRSRSATLDAAHVDKPDQESTVWERDTVESTGVPTEAQEAMHSPHDIETRCRTLTEEPPVSARPDNGALTKDSVLADDAANEHPKVDEPISSNESSDDFTDAIVGVSKNITMQETTLPSFKLTYTYLQFGDSLELRRSRILYICHDGLMLALTDANNVVGVEDLDDDMSQHLAVCSMDLLERLRAVIDSEEERIATALQPSTVQTVLQMSQYAIIASRDTSYTSPLFTSTSWHLHDARKSMTCAPDILEVYSRRQNPQDWHLAKRVSGNKDDRQENFVYMEISRKEASLPDVDGELAGVVRRVLD